LFVTFLSNFHNWFLSYSRFCLREESTVAFRRHKPALVSCTLVSSEGRARHSLIAGRTDGQSNEPELQAEYERNEFEDKRRTLGGAGMRSQGPMSTHKKRREVRRTNKAANAKWTTKQGKRILKEGEQEKMKQEAGKEREASEKRNKRARTRAEQRALHSALFVGIRFDSRLLA
jgi:hypothetical protein